MKRRILTILGTRPEIIRLSRIIPKLDQVSEHKILHTGQNYDATLNDIFFNQLRLRQPDCVLTSRGTIGQQLAATMIGVEKYINEFKPDAVLVLGDTNSGKSTLLNSLDIKRPFGLGPKIGPLGLPLDWHYFAPL